MRRDVLIFGCDAPYGTAIARRLTSDGWRVAGIVHRESAYANDFPVLALEPLDSADLATAIEQRLPDFRPQGMVVIPRRPSIAPIAATQAEDFVAAADEALVGTEIAARYLLSTPKRSSAARLVLLSGWAAMGLPGGSTAAAIMGGLLGLARSWAIELAPSGITVNAVVAGAGLEGSNWARALPPAGRHPTDDEVAHAVGFFLDERSAAINGQVLFVCGGLTPGIIPV